MALEKKVKYPQPYSIKLQAENEVLRDHLILKEHGRLKYQAKYLRSKYSKRMK